MIDPQSYRDISIIIVDDDDVDVMAVKRSFKQLRVINPIHRASNGFEALDILRGTNGREKIPKPHLILLDINMPMMNGIEFLEELRKDPDLQPTVVFILTTSDAEKDIVNAYSFNVAGYIVKSTVGSEFVDLMELIDSYWRLVQLPE